MVFQSQSYTLDDNLVLSAAALVAADAVGSVAYLDLGAANAYAEFDVVLNWTACEVATGDEKYHFRVQGSDTTAFTNAYTLGQVILGDSTVNFNAVDTAPVGRYVIHCDNVACTSATDGGSLIATRYVRIYLDVTGTIATGINYSANLVPRKPC